MKQAIKYAVPAALLAVTAFCGDVHAQALPGWRIADICAKESAPGQCALFEGRAHGAVSASWAFVLDPIRQACLAQATSPRDQSWRLLAECIDAQTLKALDKAAVNTARTPAEPVPPPRPPAPAPSEPAATPAEPPAPPADPPKAQ